MLPNCTAIFVKDYVIGDLLLWLRLAQAIKRRNVYRAVTTFPYYIGVTRVVLLVLGTLIGPYSLLVLTVIVLFKVYWHTKHLSSLFMKIIIAYIIVLKCC